MNQKHKDQIEDKVVSWSERIGASIIAILTILGVGLIIYTVVKAAIYEAPKLDQEYLTMEDTEVVPEATPETGTDNSTEQVTTPEEEASQEEVVTPEVPTEDEVKEETIVTEPEDEVTETPQTLEATCNIDGVNVREEAKTGTTIIGQLISGEKITVLNRYYSDEWVQVSYDGQTGYVYHEYLDFN